VYPTGYLPGHRLDRRADSTSESRRIRAGWWLCSSAAQRHRPGSSHLARPRSGQAPSEPAGQPCDRL